MNSRKYLFALAIFGSGVVFGLWLNAPTEMERLILPSCAPSTPITHPLMAITDSEAPVITPNETEPQIAIPDLDNPAPLEREEQASIAQLLDLARQALARNDLRATENWLERIREIAPYDPDWDLIYAEWQYRRGHQAEGLRLLIERRALDRDANRLTQIDALLDKWLPDFLAQLSPTHKWDFLSFLTRSLPDNGNYTLQLAELEVRLGKYQQAKTTLIPILYDVIWGESARKLDTIIDERTAWNRGQKVPLEIHGTQSIITARVNGNLGLRLLIDTGASLTVLNRTAAERAGLNLPASARQIQLQTISGTTNAELIRTNLELGAINLQEREVAIVDTPIASNLDGLLGMDILSNYEFLIDQNQALLLLRLK